MLHDTDEDCFLASPMDTPASSEPCMDVDMEVFANLHPPCAHSCPSEFVREWPAWHLY